MRIIQWAAFIFGAFNLVGFLGAIFDPSHEKDAAWYGVAAPILLGIGLLALIRRRQTSPSPVVHTTVVLGVIALAIVVAVIGNQVPRALASTYEGEVEVPLSGDTATSVYMTSKAWVTSDTYKETTITVALTWMDDDRWQPDLTATIQTPSGEVHCASNDFRQWLRSTGQGQADTEDLLCDTFISPSEFKDLGAVTLAQKVS